MVHEGSTLRWSCKVLQRFKPADIQAHYGNRIDADFFQHDCPKLQKAIVCYVALTDECEGMATVPQAMWRKHAKNGITDSDLVKLWVAIINVEPPAGFVDSDEEE